MCKVSVVMPAYNVSTFIADAIESVLAQTFTDFELIIVDDGSTDDTVLICNRFDDRRIRLVSQKNRGLAGARNTGIRAANRRVRGVPRCGRFVARRQVAGARRPSGRQPFGRCELLCIAIHG